MTRTICSLIFIFLFCLVNKAAANLDELQKFVKQAEFEQVKISPDGKVIAARTVFESIFAKL